MAKKTFNSKSLGVFALIDFAAHRGLRSPCWSRIGSAKKLDDGSISLHLDVYPTNATEIRVHVELPTLAEK